MFLGCIDISKVLSYPYTYILMEYTLTIYHTIGQYTTQKVSSKNPPHELLLLYYQENNKKVPTILEFLSLLITAIYKQHWFVSKQYQKMFFFLKSTPTQQLSCSHTKAHYIQTIFFHNITFQILTTIFIIWKKKI